MRLERQVGFVSPVARSFMAGLERIDLKVAVADLDTLGPVIVTLYLPDFAPFWSASSIRAFAAAISSVSSPAPASASFLVSGAS